MKVTEIFHNAHGDESVIVPENVGNLDIGSLHYRSQDVAPGGLFFAIPGLRADGHDYIPDAVNRGATAVVAQHPDTTHPRTMVTGNTRRALALAAANFHGNPSRDLFVVAITGTNGKTTAAYLVESILQQAGYSTGVIGTINYRFNGKVFKNPVTTPESLDLQRILRDMQQDGVTHVVMEVSSHALSMHRVEYCWIDVAVFTNITQDHLDYHGDMENYWRCKKSLFTDYLRTGPKKDAAIAVVNCEDPHGDQLSREIMGPIICTGAAENMAVKPQNYTSGPTGIRGTIGVPDGMVDFSSALVGDHNLENICSAAGAAVAMGVDTATIQRGIEAVECIPGRLERVANGNGRYVYVDYAHTPDALENVLRALGGIAAGRLICVFGCGGDRDRAKRPEMGRIAVDGSDLAIITSDNPRTEDPDRIIEDIVGGIEISKFHQYTPEDIKKGVSAKGFSIEPDRKQAIRIGIRASNPGDIVLIAGKGHETYQILGSETVSFDDRKEAKQILQEM